MKRLFVVISCLCWLAACASPAQHVSPTSTSHAPVVTARIDPVIRLVETPCYFPTCISYEMEVHPDGGYKLDGRKNTRTQGVTTGSLGPDVWPKALAAFDAAGFAAMPATIAPGASAGGPPCINDLPAVEFTRIAADKTNAAISEKKVVWNTGCASAPAFKLLEDLRKLFRYSDLVKPPER